MSRLPVRCSPGGRSVCRSPWLALALWAGTTLLTIEAGGSKRMNGFDLSNSSVARREILSGGQPRDGIPSIDRPRFIRARAAHYLHGGDLVVSVTVGDETRAYPVRILTQHEVVNDRIAGQPIAVTYCPLCGTAMVFNRRIGERVLEFGVSGLLFRSDVLMYDRQTKSLWSQLAMKSVAGLLVDTPLEWLPSEHLTWEAWRARYPNGKVLSTRTGSMRSYEKDPYTSYGRSPGNLFPVPVHRTELPRKAWVVGVIINGAAKAYPVAELWENLSLTDTVGGIEIQVDYDPVSQLTTVRQLHQGWSLPCVKAYWFAWQAFYPDTGLWTQW